MPPPPRIVARPPNVLNLYDWFEAGYEAVAGDNGRKNAILLIHKEACDFPAELARFEADEARK